MTPTVPVTVDLASQGGPALAGITVRARLDVNEVYQGFVISDVVEAVTDATGVAVLNCFPNAPDPTGLGTQGSTYSFRAAIPGGRGLNVEARVPNAACRLENILVNDTAVALDAAQLAVLQAQDSAAAAATSANEAEAAQAAALATANASMWVSGTNYALGANVISPVDLFTYRRKVAGAGVTDPSADAANWMQLTSSAAQIQSSALIVSGAGGTANAITATYSPAITALANGMALYVRAASANTTTTPTFTPNNGTIAAKPIVKGNGLALVAGDIAGAGHWVELQYDATLNKWVLLNPATGVVNNVIPLGASNNGTGASVAATTATLTAPCKGVAHVTYIGAWNATPAGSSFSSSASLAGLVTLSQNVMGVVDIVTAKLPMLAGQSSTFTATIGQTSSVNMQVSIDVVFIPTV